MLAARAGSAEMVTLLFENRADPLIEDTTGLTALEYCGDDQVPTNPKHQLTSLAQSPHSQSTQPHTQGL